jgi:caa(3)-type oxidase subunit IV
MSHHDHAHAEGHDGHDHGGHFSENKILLQLLVLTVLEVGWGLAGKHFGWNKLSLWGGLLFFAFLKGWLIAVYFMHLKFEGWVVKSLILPTPFLVMVIMGYVMPDVADGETPLAHPVGSALDPKTGRVIEDMGEAWQLPGKDHTAPAGH